MAISSTQSYVEYTGDSSTTSFTIPFYFLLNSDISVMVADADGNITELTNGTDFTVTGQGVSTGGTCVLNTAYSNSYSILVYREPPETQETKYYENGKFPAKSHESALDKLTMLIQRFGWMWDSLALKRPNYFADFYDANGHRISDMQDPKSAQDAATKNYVDTQVSAEAAARILADQLLSQRDDQQQAQINKNSESYKALIALVGQILSGKYSVLGDYSAGPYTITAYDQLITKDGYFYALKSSVALPYTTTGNTATTWATDEANFVAVGDAALRQELAASGLMDMSVSETNDMTDPGKVIELSFGANNGAHIKVSSPGALYYGHDEGGIPSSRNRAVPYILNTGNIIDTTLGAFAEKRLFLPSFNFDDMYQSPSIGITYDANGLPEFDVINPVQNTASTLGWPNQKAVGVTFRRVAFKDFTEATYAKAPASLSQSSSTRYIQVAKWKVSSTPWNTEYKAMLISSNTDDRFIGSLTLEADVQASGNAFATAANLTQSNVSKYFLSKFDGPTDRIPYATATSFSIPTFGVTTDGTYLYLWAVIPAGYSGTKITEIHKGTGTALTTDYTASTVQTAAPSGLVMVPVHADYNGNNASMANDGRLLSTDNHVRVCNTSGSNTTRPDIQKDGFLWAGYGTYKSNRQDCVITKTGTGTYVVTGPHIGGGWTLTQPYDGTGQQVAIAQVSTSADGLTNTISVYAISYTLNTTTNQVTRGTGALMDIPAGSWVDLHASTTF
ncbi:hypothetical protein [Tatumella ptyseos]|uniref:hypothetical protein n=1 Tax=Tatumella ptyseos TaxID=82987 RepID=UPI0023F01284|nr:hypothetical protein [Tatumella ptyseos]